MCLCHDENQKDRSIDEEREKGAVTVAFPTRPNGSTGSIRHWFHGTAAVHGRSKPRIFQTQGKTGDLPCFSSRCDRGRSPAGPLFPSGPVSRGKIHPAQPHVCQRNSRNMQKRQFSCSPPGAGLPSQLSAREEEAHQKAPALPLSNESRKKGKNSNFLAVALVEISSQVPGGEREAHATNLAVVLSNELLKKFKNCKNAQIRAVTSP